MGTQPAEAPKEDAEGDVESPPASEPKPAKGGDTDGNAPKPKVNPWKLLDEHKAARAKAESEIAELKKLVPNEAARKQEIAELEQLRARAKELEDEIRYVNYEKSPEFKEKYDEPYKKSWSKAMHELAEISIEDPDTGQTRQFTANEMLKLVNMPLAEARKVADELYGSLANDVMTHRKEIKNLFEARATALEEARTKGAEREQKTLEQVKAANETITKQITETYTKANESITKDEKYGAYFTPIEGDQDGNQRLAKGFELVDRAFQENPMDPRLTPEQRESIVKRHAAVRNRAAAFGRLVFQNQQAKTRIAELEAELAQFKGSEPTATGTTPPNTTPAPMSAREQMEAALAKLVKPG